MSDFKFYVDNHQIVRWNSNDSVPFPDMLSQLLVDELITIDQVKVSNKVREEESANFLKQYRKAKTVELSPEQIFEMKSAFGEGSAIIDVITGKVVRF